MFRILIGMVLGGLIVAYTGTGRDVRSVTNEMATELKKATEPTLLERLEEEVIDDLRK